MCIKFVGLFGLDEFGMIMEKCPSVSSLRLKGCAGHFTPLDILYVLEDKMKNLKKLFLDLDFDVYIGNNYSNVNLQKEIGFKNGLKIYTKYYAETKILHNYYYYWKYLRDHKYIKLFRNAKKCNGHP